MSARLTWDIVLDLRMWAPRCAPPFADLMREAADRLEDLITLLAEAEAEPAPSTPEPDLTPAAPQPWQTDASFDPTGTSAAGGVA